MQTDIQTIIRRATDEGYELTLRKPLAPKCDNRECKVMYEELLSEFNELKKWDVDDLACMYAQMSSRRKGDSPDGKGVIVDLSDDVAVRYNDDGSEDLSGKRLGVLTDDGTVVEKEKFLVETDRYNARIGEYSVRRHKYNERFAGLIESIEDVKVKIEELRSKKESAKREMDEALKKHNAKWDKSSFDMSDEDKIRWQLDWDKLHSEGSPFAAYVAIRDELRDEERKFSVTQYAWDMISE